MRGSPLNKTMKTSRLLLLLTAGLSPVALLMSGCAKSDSTSSEVTKIKADANDAAASATVVVSNSWDGIKDFGYERRADFSAGMDRLSADLDDRTREFRAKHAGATDAMAKDRDAAAKEYDEARADLKTRMTDLGNATAATWSDSKAKAADSYKRVQAAYDKANATPHS